MKVTATAKGYLGCVREPGNVFEVADGLKGSWFTPVPEAPAPEAPKAAKGAAKKAAQADPGDDDAII